MAESPSNIPDGAKPQRACPICGKPAEPEFRPFCSKRCANVDLNRWLSGGYAIPAVESDEPDENDGTEEGRG